MTTSARTPLRMRAGECGQARNRIFTCSFDLDGCTHVPPGRRALEERDPELSATGRSPPSAKGGPCRTYKRRQARFVLACVRSREPGQEAFP
jgi:hypothetical protein